jgi:hypothetical protein
MCEYVPIRRSFHRVMIIGALKLDQLSYVATLDYAKVHVPVKTAKSEFEVQIMAAEGKNRHEEQ